MGKEKEKSVGGGEEVGQGIERKSPWASVVDAAGSRRTAAIDGTCRVRSRVHQAAVMCPFHILLLSSLSSPNSQAPKHPLMPPWDVNSHPLQSTGTSQVSPLQYKPRVGRKEDKKIFNLGLYFVALCWTVLQQWVVRIVLHAVSMKGRQERTALTKHLSVLCQISERQIPN